MKSKTLGLFLCTLIAMSACGIAYAQWNDMVVVQSRMTFGTLTLRFVGTPDCSDNDDATKDTGVCVCEYTDPDTTSGGYETLMVNIVNGYPSYEADCIFTLQNVGSLPDHVIGIEIVPSMGLTVGETFLDDIGNPIGWRLDDTTTGEPQLTVYVQNSEESSLVCSVVDSGTQLTGILNVIVNDGAMECHAFGFEIMIIYED